MFQFIEYMFRTLTFIELFMFFGKLITILSLIISFIFAIIIHYKVAPEIERRHEFILVFPLFSGRGPIFIKTGYCFALHIFHKYIRNIFVNNKNNKTITYNYQRMTIHQIKYNIHAENKTNLFLCCFCALNIYIWVILLTGLSILTISFGWN